LAASWLWPLGVVTALLHLQERRRPPPSSSRSWTTRAGGDVPDGVPHLNLASPGPSVASGALARPHDGHRAASLLQEAGGLGDAFLHGLITATPP